MTIVIAHSYSKSTLTGATIRPGSEITPIDGSWALTAEVIEHERKCHEARMFREQLAFFLNRLPEVK